MSTSPDNPGRDREEFLCVDFFLSTLVGARALATALELGLVDLLQERGPYDLVSLGRALRLEPEPLDLLLGLLRSNEVVDEHHGTIDLTPRFKTALRFRDLLVAKLDFARFVLQDFTEGFTAALRDPEGFLENSRVLDLFSYGRCLEINPENVLRARRWMRITSCLTRYEAEACMRQHDFSGYRRILDIGGNSGEMALQLCRKVSKARATVFDLPVVCEIGRAHVRGEPEAERITFTSGNARTDDLPRGFDLVIFKSMLHDWPEEASRRLIASASQSLEPGGTMLIFERAPIAFEGPTPFSMIPFLLFFRSFRSPGVYEDELKRLGFAPIRIKTVRLEMDFSLLTAIKKV